ncbi:hypothetical protein KJ780_03310 [Candidatus Micrarchaeota archaeon]|nr:hypothetical protein [Candidatus Micrarchaeota archaeon]
MNELEEAFEKTTQLVLGNGLTDLNEYKEWLEKDLFGKIGRTKSVKSGKAVYFPSVPNFERIAGNMLTLEESLEYGKNALSEKQVEKLSLKNAGETLKGISSTSVEVVYGHNIGIKECAGYGPSQYCYRSCFAWFDKFCACSFWPRTSEYCFGVSRILDSKFCIRCFDSTNLTRCFEVSDSTSCSDLYFSHNCENVRDGILCFNIKNKKYAVGNIEVGREQYMRIKKMLLEWVGKELEGKKKLEIRIFNIGCD